MTPPIRVPMPNRKASWVGADDIAAAITSVRLGQRVSMDIAEEALAQMGREAIPFVVEKLAHRIVFDHYRDIQSTVDKYLSDHAWAAPIIEDEIRKAVRSYMLDMLKDIYERDEPPVG